ncbi:MAG: hypothetical protein FJ286_01920 [Planctomycetes bacterium]|nr:hypothetical protein [Planctomycetota bacterium]
MGSQVGVLGAVTLDDGGRKRRRGDRVAAVQNGGAQPCRSLGGEDRGDSPDLLRSKAKHSGSISTAARTSFGPSGTGKTHLATAFGMAACSQGRKVRFFRVTELVTLLLEAKEERHLLRMRVRTAQPPLAAGVTP